MIRVLLCAAALLVFTVLLATARAQTPAVEVTSPNHVEIYAKSSLTQHTLSWDKQRGELTVSLQFSDSDYTDSIAHDETFEFSIPGIAFDSKSGLFTLDDGRGNPLPVARRHTVVFISEIEPTPNAAFRIRRGDDGKIGVVLTVYRPEVAAALGELPQPGEKMVPLPSLFQK